MKEYPLVSILIPLYNAEKYFVETMESLLAQSYNNIEIIIVNDGSTDNSLNIAREYESQHNHIKVYTQENSGAQVARNKAFEMSSGEYIQYFDADDIMHPEKIASQMEVLRQYSFKDDIVATGIWMRFFDSIDKAVPNKQIINKDYDDMFLFIDESCKNNEYMNGQAWLIPRRINEIVGDWDIRLTRLQDVDFFTRVPYHADKILFVKESIIYYRKGVSNSITSDSTSYKAKRSYLDYINSYYNLLRNDLDKYSLREGVAKKYSVFYAIYYPLDKQTKDEVCSKLQSLGYNQPLIAFSWIVKIFGLHTGLRFRKMKTLLIALLVKHYR